MIQAQTTDQLLAAQTPVALAQALQRPESDPIVIALSAFLSGLQQRQDAHQKVAFKAHLENAEFMAAHRDYFAISPGAKRYVRVIIRSASGTTGSAYCFVDLHNGDIFKPASWKGPEKNFTRGNILNPTSNDGGAYSWTSPYGIRRAR